MVPIFRDQNFPKILSPSLRALQSTKLFQSKHRAGVLATACAHKNQNKQKILLLGTQVLQGQPVKWVQLEPQPP